MADSPIVTSEVLLKGSIYALEQCGHLLHDAVTLYDSGSYSTAIVLAQFANEELGRHRKYRDWWKDSVEKGEMITVQGLRDWSEKHVEKQASGQVGLILRTDGGDRLAELLHTVHHSPPHSEARMKAYEELEEIQKRKQKSVPTERLKQRMAALYVDINDAGTGWRLPREKSQREACNAIEDIMAGYGMITSNLRPEFLSHLDPKFAAALEAWIDRPTLPPLPKFQL
jgi:AbiV family abortive infection protein